jgi:hypothetical protein
MPVFHRQLYKRKWHTESAHNYVTDSYIDNKNISGLAQVVIFPHDVADDNIAECTNEHYCTIENNKVRFRFRIEKFVVVTIILQYCFEAVIVNVV